MAKSHQTILDRREILKAFSIAGAVGALPSFLTSQALAAEEALTLWGIPASPSAVFARALQSGALDGYTPAPVFSVWKSTDQMRAGIASGKFKLFGTSTYAAANFFNRGAGIKMVNVVTWGVLYIMARDKTITKIEDLAGKKVLLSNKNEAPDLLFRLCLKWSGMDPDKDVQLDYVGSPGEAVPLYLSGRGDICVLHEPASTAALLRAKKAKIPLYRAIDVTEIYGKHTGRGPKVPQVGLAANPAFLDAHANLVEAVHQACVEAGKWVLENPQEAGKIASKTLPLPAPIIAKSLPFIHLDVQSAKQAREDIEIYFDHLMSLNPKIVGGKIPDSSFYWG